MTATSTKGLSTPATTRAVLELLSGLDWQSARVADVGAGRGHFCAVVSEWLRARGIDPGPRLLPCDLHPETFQAPGIACARTGPDGRLPYPDASCDAVVSIEVVEHVEDQFGFVRELARIARPGARVIVTTPNVLSLTSRARTLLWGFPELFDPLPLRDGDVRFLSGHIHPISPYFLALCALRAGLEDPRLSGDRTKRSAVAWMVPLAPALIGMRLAQRARLARKAPAVLEQNSELLRALSSFAMLTARTVILCARKPSDAKRPAPGSAARTTVTA
jgi:SAM-dependent methyltransferase